MSHANARTTLYARRLMVARVQAGHRPADVAKQLGVSRPTVYKWLGRHCTEGDAGLRDRSSRPLSPARLTPPDVVTRICQARIELHAGPQRLAERLSIPASTIGVVLRRSGMPRLCDIDRLTGQPVRVPRHSNVRYEHCSPGSLLHIDVMKLGCIPDGGGWRVHGHEVDPSRHRKLGWDYVHVAIDDYSRVAYAEVLGDETGLTCAEFLHRAVCWFRDHGVIVRRLLTDNAKAYRVERNWIAVCEALELKRRFIRPGHPWTNGKAERFNRTLQNEWAYARLWTSNAQRTAALDEFLAYYNTERRHSSLAGRPPISRMPS